MNVRLGLTGKFYLSVLATAVLCLSIGLVAWRQQTAGLQQMVQTSADVIHDANVHNEERRALVMAQLMANTLVNPLYYFDLVAIGEVTRSALAESDVLYVLIYDASGRIVHDGSANISRFGQRMGDSLAAGAVEARSPVVRATETVIDAVVPIWLGKDRIGGVRVGISLTGANGLEQAAAARVKDQGYYLQQHLLGVVIILMVCLLLWVGLVSWYISWDLLRPVQRVAEAVRRLGQGDYTIAWPRSQRQDEIGQLEEAFATMGDSVARHDRDIRQLAFGDSLTGLPNRIGFRDALEKRVQDATQMSAQLALLLIDLDDFKRINDAYGHDMGDAVLLRFVERMQGVMASMAVRNAELARFGGDEFVILVQGDDLREQVSRLSMALLTELREPMHLDQQTLMLAVSIGVAQYPQHAAQAQILLKNAEIAMHRAKLDGKNCVRFYSRGMDVAVEYQLRMEQDLHRALKHNELSVAYQPIYSVSDLRLVGVEALARWTHPQRGPISPAEFIPLAEQTDQIDEIGRFVLHTACQAAARWARMKETFSVSVNVSARQLQRGNLSDVVEQELVYSGLKPACLHLELTETAALTHEEDVVKASIRLRHAGVQVWLDDFGTGFSGLSHLRRIPVDGVKIDRSFIVDMLEDADDLALTAAIIAMAHSLGSVVVAEGVETEAQFRTLQDRGCDFVQGFWLGKPMSEAEISERLLQEISAASPVVTG